MTDRRRTAGRGQASTSQDAVRQEREDQERRGRSGSSFLNEELMAQHNIGFYTAKEGSNWISILPAKEENRYFGLHVYVHYSVGPNGRAFLCPRWNLTTKAWKNVACPICKQRFQLKDEGANEETIRKLSASRRCLFLVVDAKNPETEEEGRKVYIAPSTVANAVLDLSVDPREPDEIIVLSDPSEGNGHGLNVCFKRSGRTMTNTKYSMFKTENRENSLPEEYYDVPSLLDLVVPATAEEIAEEFLGVEEEEEDEKTNDPETDDLVNVNGNFQEPDEGEETHDRRQSGATDGERRAAVEQARRAVTGQDGQRRRRS